MLLRLQAERDRLKEEEAKMEKRWEKAEEER